MKLEPYLFFYGRCEEALEFYTSAFGGSYEANRFKGSPIAEQMPPGSDNLIMHATFTGPGLSFMASDGPVEKPADAEGGCVSLSLATQDSAEGERVFKALAEGGEVKSALEDVFWGGKYGILTDKFGIEWMMSIF